MRPCAVPNPQPIENSMDLPLILVTPVVCYVGDVAEEALRDTNASTDDDDFYTDEYAYAVDGGCNIPVLINGVGVDIVIDSGASCKYYKR